MVILKNTKLQEKVKITKKLKLNMRKIHWNKILWGGKIALTRWTFISDVMSLIFNTLSRFVIAFLPRSKHLLISWLQSPTAVILEPKKIKYITASAFFPSICHEVMGPDAMILVF